MERGEVAKMQEIAEVEMPAKNCRNACQKLQNAVIPEIAECGNALGVAGTKQWRSMLLMVVLKEDCEKARKAQRNQEKLKKETRKA